jgi:hypothetical protein
VKHLSRDEVLAACGPSVRAANPQLFPQAVPAPPAPSTHARTSRRASGRTEVAPYKSKAESSYALVLEARRLAGEITGWSYETVTLVIGDDGKRKAHYTPDFVVLHNDGRIQFVEVKGAYAREASRVRYRVAVERYQWALWTWAEALPRGAGFDERRAP